MDSSKLEKLIHALLKELGENPKREGLLDTPKRVAKSYAKLLEGYSKKPAELKAVFDSEDYDEMIIAKEIEFYSMCEHHMLPFFGKVSIGYLPNKKIIGLSKLPRLVEIFARRLQNQERLTQQIANALQDLLKPRGVGVIVEASHLCTRMRGVEKEKVTMVTSALTGHFKKDPKTRDEFLRLVGK
ncbi:MAG: GTP cyclohydrolase I FolE [Candidatus Gracilibacteria bacterium]|jgi:GTP cyclohydrolase I